MQDWFHGTDKLRAELRCNGEAARMNADEGVTPEVGKVYTVSPSFTNGDRSWVDAFWEIKAFSGPNVLVLIHDTHRTITHLFRTDERAWYPADDAFAAFQKMRAEGDE